MKNKDGWRRERKDREKKGGNMKEKKTEKEITKEEEKNKGKRFKSVSLAAAEHGNLPSERNNSLATQIRDVSRR